MKKEQGFNTEIAEEEERDDKEDRARRPDAEARSRGESGGGLRKVGMDFGGAED